MSVLQYLAFYKPDGVLCTFTDEEGRETLREYIPIPEVYSAGRLDRDSEGLLILSNDGDLLHLLTHPRHHLPKTYLVQVEGAITPQALLQMEAGIAVKGETTLPCQALAVEPPELPARRKPLTPHAPTSWVQVVLQEGKKRQIRHMTAAVGFPTLRLVRVAVGPIALGELQPGQWRFLTPREVESLKGKPFPARRTRKPIR
jgi:23S rRNA pseudouridine2457 synthase